jgi:DnaJ-class molecular chaperone
MKKIVEYRKLLNVDKTAELKDLKTIYRRHEEAHPDKFQVMKLKAAEESKKIIEAYHFHQSRDNQAKYASILKL